MELLFKKYFWILNSVLLVGGGFATSRALSAYVEHEVLSAPVASAAGEGDDLVEEEDLVFRRPVASRSVDLARRRELSKPAVTELKEEAPVEEAPVEEAPPELEQPVEEQAEEINLELIAVITATDENQNSAMVKIDGGDPKWVGIGSDVKAGYKVVRITNYYIEVTRGQTALLWKKLDPAAQQRPMLAAGRGMTTPPRTPPISKPEAISTPPSPPSGNAYAEGVRQTGPFDYTLDRGMLNEQLQDLAKLGREARVIPNYDKDTGSYKGFKLIGVRPNSLYRAIGIRSGDVIMQINGEELSSPGKALELFTKLQTSSSISLDVMRRGKQQTMSYKIE